MSTDFPPVPEGGNQTFEEALELAANPEPEMAPEPFSWDEIPVREPLADDIGGSGWVGHEHAENAPEVKQEALKDQTFAILGVSIFKGETYGNLTARSHIMDQSGAKRWSYLSGKVVMKKIQARIERNEIPFQCRLVKRQGKANPYWDLVEPTS